MIAVDTNLLVYAHRTDSPFHERARSLIESLAGKTQGQVVEGDLRFPLVVRLPDRYRTDPASVEAMLVQTSQGELIPLGHLARIQVTEAPPKITQELIFAARKEVNAIHVAEAAEKYIVDLVIGTREPKCYGGDLAKWINLGASPRGTLALDAAARAHAWLQGQDFVSPDNIRAVAPACLAHRIHLSYEAEAAGKTRNDVIEALLKAVVSV